VPAARPEIAPAFLSARDVAARLGRSQDWLRDNLDRLRAQGFPERERLVGLYHAADVEAWIASRARIAHHSESRIMKSQPATSR
jgi:predicted DNA-binding transcriptional regulator AlpA